MKIHDLLICDDFSYIKDSDIIIYGTGYWGKKVYEMLKALGVGIIGACNTERTRELFYGYPIMSLNDIKEEYDKSNALIIAASSDYYKEMLCNCEKKSFSYAKVCSLYAFYTSFYLHCDDEKIPEQLRVEIRSNLAASETRLEYNNKLYAYDMMIRAVEENMIYIYQPGKVGSRSVWNTIYDKSIHFHSLVIPFGCEEFPKEQMNFYLGKVRNKKVKIITGVREPIARDLAAMFQNSGNDIWPFTSANSNIFGCYGDFLRDENISLSRSEIIKRYPRWKGTLTESFRRLSASIMEYGLDEFSWFNNEIHAVFGIDVFQEPFDKERGYAIIRRGNVEIFIYKLEKLAGLENVIGDFIGEKGYRLENTNLSENKTYYYAYQELKETIKLSREYFQYYYHDNLAYRHFYTDEEISRNKKIWEEHVVNNG